MFVKVSLLSFVATWFGYGTYLIITKHTANSNLTQPDTEIAENQNENSGSSPITKETSQSETSALMALKPSFGKLPSELFADDSSFNLDFHKLPQKMMTPQDPDNTKAAVFRMKELNQALSEAAKASEQRHKLFSNQDNPGEPK